MTVGAFAIIRDGEGRFLLSHRRDMDLWNLPGGGVEPMEAPWDAAVREVREETGMEVRVRRLVGVHTKAGADAIAFSFHCDVVSGEPTPSEEADEHRYFALAEIPVNTSPKQVERLRDFLRAPEEVTLRVQTLPSSREHLASLPRGEG